MIALSSGIIAWELYSHQKVKLEERIGKELIGIAATAALGIDPDVHENIYVEEDGTLGGLDSFERIRDQLRKTVEVNQLEKPMYTLRKTFDFAETGMMGFVVMTDEKDGRHYAGNTIKATSHVLKVYESGKPHATPLYSDEEGTWISGLAPIKDENGSVIGILSCDREVKFFLADLAKVRATIFGTAGVSLLIGAFCFVLLSRPIVSGIQRLTRGVQMVGQNELSYRIDLVRPEGEGDEIDELATAFNRMVGGLEERDRIRDLLGKVVDPAIAEKLLQQKEILLGGEEREVTILFSDIRGFTTLSESRSSTDILSFLNIYLTHMGQVIEHNGGIVDKFIGDAIMALWGAPICHEDDVDRALCAAIEMSNELAGLNELLQTADWPLIEIGIGVHTDMVVAGNMGSPDRLNYTVIGDGVNLASRLETLTKEYEARIIVSEATLAKARLDYETRDLGTVKVKGRSEETRIFELLGKK